MKNKLGTLAGAPTSFAIIMAGEYPPGLDMSQAVATLLASITANLPMTQHLKSSAVVFSDDQPLDLIKRAAEACGSPIVKLTQ